MYFVYILLCGDGSLYTGITNNLERRFEAHKNGKGGHYTRARKVVKFVYTEEHSSRSLALKREAEIKSWKKEDKLILIKYGANKADRCL
ncbi:GIY-YIG nuclease family protein [Candidatus Nomurabacteria bacterium]|nr:GIY-YIG nuclease family protein [Candidatus Nomurabacteria bacterium]MCB9819397.1 GIY-YIG nuclease family protein [Candidatus Nomurabacteria bacterium]